MFFLFIFWATICSAHPLMGGQGAPLNPVLSSFILAALLMASNLTLKKKTKNISFFMAVVLVFATAIMASQFILLSLFYSLLTLIALIVSVLIMVSGFTWNKKNYKKLSIIYYFLLLIIIISSIVV